METKGMRGGLRACCLGVGLAAALVTSCGGRLSQQEKIGSTASAVSVMPTVVVTASSHIVTSLGTGHCSTPSFSTTLGTPLSVPNDALSRPLVSFEGLDNTDNCGGNASSDDNGAIGPHHYVQYVNWAITVFDRTGRLLAGPVSDLFGRGGGNACNGWSDGVVSYDRYADRWVFSHGGLGVECLAISQTGDPTGAYDVYTFQVSDTTKFYDFQKLGVWSDGYYVTANDCTLSGGTSGGCTGWTANNVAVFERSAMLRGANAPRAVAWNMPMAPINRWVPAFVDGANLPPNGTPNFVLGIQGTFTATNDKVQINEVHVDWTNPSNSTFTPTTSLLPNPGFSLQICQSNTDISCLPQPAPGSLPQNPLLEGFNYRVIYRNFGNHEAMVISHPIAADGDPAPPPPAPIHSGVRWYELRRSGGAWSIFQQGTQAPDASNRWLGNVDMDGNGNIALAYVAASALLNPSIRYAGRLSTDPTGQLPEVERSLAEGLGSQMNSNGNADYSDMTLDPLDDCTFWATNTYVPVSGPPNVFSNWHTRIGAFRFNTCDRPEPPATGQVAAVRQSANVTAIFSVGSDGALYDRSITANSSTWSAPQALTATNAAPPGAGVVAALQTLNQLDVFYVGNDRQVHYVWETNDGTWQPPTTLPGQPANFAPAGALLATATQGGQLGVAVIDSNGALQIFWWNALGWFGPVAVTGSGYAPAGAPLTIGRRANGELDAFSIGTDGTLKYMAYNGGLWSGPWLLSSAGFAQPGGSVASANDVYGFLNVFTIARDGAVYTKWDCTPLWCGPTALTSASVAPPGGTVSAVNYANLALDLFYVPNTGALNALWNTGASWQGPLVMTGAGALSPGAATAEATQGASSLDLVAVGTIGLYEETYTSAWSIPSFLP